MTNRGQPAKRVRGEFKCTANYFIEKASWRMARDRRRTPALSREFAYTHPLYPLTRTRTDTNRTLPTDTRARASESSPIERAACATKASASAYHQGSGQSEFSHPRADKGYLRHGASRNRPVRTGVRAPPAAAPPAGGVAEAVLYRAAAATVRSHHIDRRGASGAHHRS